MLLGCVTSITAVTFIFCSFMDPFQFVTGFTKLLLGKQEFFKRFQRKAMGKLNSFLELMGTCDSNEYLLVLEECFNFYLCCMDECQFLIDGVIRFESERAVLPSEFVLDGSERFRDEYGCDGTDEICGLYVACVDGFHKYMNLFNKVKKNKLEKLELECLDIRVDEFRSSIDTFQRSLTQRFTDAERFVKGNRFTIYGYNCGSSVKHNRDPIIRFAESRPSWNIHNSLWHSMSYAQRLELRRTLGVLDLNCVYEMSEEEED